MHETQRKFDQFKLAAPDSDTARRMSAPGQTYDEYLAWWGYDRKKLSSDYKDDGHNILLDANENAYGPGLAPDPFGNGSTNGVAVNGSRNDTPEQGIDILGLNRYPDPHQYALKQRFCDYRNSQNPGGNGLRPVNLFVGVGSDEAIDAVLRCFCRPGQDKLLTCPPTYGMYAVSAHVNDVAVIHVPLDVDDGFALRASEINSKLTAEPNIKAVYICSPGNPTGSVVSKPAVKQILSHPTWNGVVVIDEAYIDFAAPSDSFAQWVLDHPNLIVMQTLSKAFGLAGIRLGVAMTSVPIARLMNNLKAPYNISSPTSALATAALSAENLAVMHEHRAAILAQRDRLLNELLAIPGIGRLRGGTDANYLLVEVLSAPSGSGKRPSNEVALRVYETLAGRRGVVVRFRGKEFGCQGCLRVTVGTEREVDRFLREIKDVLKEVYDEGSRSVEVNGRDEEELERREKSASDVVA
ncbi:MAG: histidinol-phosphate transaminase [Peltula sp. TS41687]|nr:MAG: histidinol-phosphate transaminase [Peltula sp. TS41687]